MLMPVTVLTLAKAVAEARQDPDAESFMVDGQASTYVRAARAGGRAPTRAARAARRVPTAGPALLQPPTFFAPPARRRR